ncbi:MAG: asparagine synthase-related protein [Eubacteriales bacterium]|nr:asparagine synthase-related protein [Eubacteriales bacterium]
MTECVRCMIAMTGDALPADVLAVLPGATTVASWQYLSGGEQVDEGGVRVFFSGRLSNHSELAAAVGLAGDCSCSALLGRLFVMRGVAGFAELNGPFVAAIVQDYPRRLTLVRDQHGQQFLYYARRNDGVVFFSDSISLLRSCPGVELGVDFHALSDYLSLGYVPSPRSIYRGIGKVGAGTAISWRGGGDAVIERYWQPLAGKRSTLKYSEVLEETRRLLEQSINRCLRLFPDIGILLSGGIDSSLILGIAAPLKEGLFRSFTIGFEHGNYDERALAAEAAAMAGAEHAERVVTPGDLSLLPELLAAAGEPFADSSLLPTAVAMRFAAAGGCRAVFMGDGGDELFGGYRRYQVMAMRERLRLLPRGAVRAMAKGVLGCLPEHAEQRTALSSLRRLAAAYAQEALPCYASFQELFSPAMRFELTAPAALREAPSYLDGWAGDIATSGLSDLVEQMNLLDLLHYVPDDGCRKDVLAAMGTGVQPLAPILDMEVTRFALQLPRHYRVTCRARKRLLCSLGAGIIPPTLLRQTKRGFGVPVASWLRGELALALRALVAEQRQWDHEGWFDSGVLARYVNEHLTAQRDHSARLWALYCLRLWLDSVRQA